MDSRHLVDPELLDALDTSPLDELTLARLPEIRATHAYQRDFLQALARALEPALARVPAGAV